MSNITHGKSKTPVYHSWQRVVHCCFLQYTLLYRTYGARGITAPESWTKFESFYEDMGERPPGKVLRRKDVKKPFSKENCYWGEPLLKRRKHEVVSS